MPCPRKSIMIRISPDADGRSPAAGNFGITDDSMDSVDRTLALQCGARRHRTVRVLLRRGHRGWRSVHPLLLHGAHFRAADQLSGWRASPAWRLWLLLTNLRFWRKLRKVRMPYTVEGCKYPVYLVEAGLPSPCLFGLVRPAVYLTPAAAADAGAAAPRDRPRERPRPAPGPPVGPAAGGVPDGVLVRPAGVAGRRRVQGRRGAGLRRGRPGGPGPGGAGALRKDPAGPDPGGTGPRRPACSPPPP